MPRIEFGPTLFVVTAVTYAPNLKDGTWHTRVEAEQYTGPTVYTGPDEGSEPYEAPTPIVTLVEDPEYAGSTVAVLSAQTSYVPTSVVEAVAWTYGDGGSSEQEGPWPVDEVPPDPHPYPAEGTYLVTLALRTQGVWCAPAGIDITVPVVFEAP
jgi:PKD domain